ILPQTFFYFKIPVIYLIIGSGKSKVFYINRKWRTITGSLFMKPDNTDALPFKILLSPLPELVAHIPIRSIAKQSFEFDVLKFGIVLRSHQFFFTAVADGHMNSPFFR